MSEMTPHQVVTLELLRVSLSGEESGLSAQGRRALSRWLVSHVPDRAAEPSAPELVRALGSRLSVEDASTLEFYLLRELPGLLASPNDLLDLVSRARACLADARDVADAAHEGAGGAEQGSAAGLLVRSLCADFASLDFLDVCRLLDDTAAYLTPGGGAGAGAGRGPGGAPDPAGAHGVPQETLAALLARAAEDVRLGEAGAPGRVGEAAAATRAAGERAGAAPGAGGAAPSLQPRAEWLLHLLALEERDPTSALRHLHRFYDLTGGGRGEPGAGAAQVGRFQVALLALASMHARLGNAPEATQALTEAFRVAQQRGDSASLAQALGTLGTLAALGQHGELGEQGGGGAGGAWGTAPAWLSLGGVWAQCARRAEELRLPELQAHATAALARAMASAGGWGAAGLQGGAATAAANAAARLAGRVATAAGARAPALFSGGAARVLDVRSRGGADGALPAVLDAAAACRLTEASALALSGCAGVSRARLEAFLRSDWGAAAAPTKVAAVAMLAHALEREEGPAAALGLLAAAEGALRPGAGRQLAAARLRVQHDAQLRRGQLRAARRTLSALAAAVAAQPAGGRHESEAELLVRRSRGSLAEGDAAAAGRAAREALALCARHALAPLAGHALLALARASGAGGGAPLSAVVDAAAAAEHAREVGDALTEAAAQGQLALATLRAHPEAAEAAAAGVAPAVEAAAAGGDAALEGELRAAAAKCCAAAGARGGGARGEALLQRAGEWAALAASQLRGAQCWGAAAGAAQLAAVAYERLGDRGARDLMAAQWLELRDRVGRGD